MRLIAETLNVLQLRVGGEAIGRSNHAFEAALNSWIRLIGNPRATGGPVGRLVSTTDSYNH